MIYQHVNKRTTMLSLATSHKAHYCNQLKHVAQPIFYATFYKHYFYWDSSKFKLFFQKNAKLSSAGGSAPSPRAFGG